MSGDQRNGYFPVFHRIGGLMRSRVMPLPISGNGLLLMNDAKGSSVPR
jgi:hypothetical protein